MEQKQKGKFYPPNIVMFDEDKYEQLAEGLMVGMDFVLYRCNQCGERFDVKWPLIRQADGRIVHGDEPLPESSEDCPECGSCDTERV